MKIYRNSTVDYQIYSRTKNEHFQQFEEDNRTMILRDRFNLTPGAHPKHDVVILAKPRLDQVKEFVVGNVELSLYDSQNECVYGKNQRNIKVAKMLNLAVARAWEGRKVYGKDSTVAQTLVEAALQEAQDGHSAYVFLDVKADNDRAMKLYEKMGFKVGDDALEKMEQQPFMNSDSRAVQFGRREDHVRLFYPLCLKQERVEAIESMGGSVFAENIKSYMDGNTPKINMNQKRGGQ